MKKEFPISDEWLNFEIHPETPTQGVLLSERLPHIDWGQMYEGLRQRGSQFGITFGHVRVLSNSRTALEAGEYARDHERYDLFNEKMFSAYFTEAMDIGSVTVVLDIAKAVGLNPAGLSKALDEKRYLSRIEEVRKEAHQLRISSVPTFIIDGRHKVVGAQPLETFREIFAQIY